jgi:hypothetical protein
MVAPLAEHVAHVEPNQVAPTRAWLTCNDVEVASIDIDPSTDSPDRLVQFFDGAMVHHLSVCPHRDQG